MARKVIELACGVSGDVQELCAAMPSAKVMRELHGKGVVIPRAYVLRGGCWYLDAKDCRSARRHAIGFGAVPEQLVGFRICCVLPGELVFTGKKML